MRLSGTCCLLIGVVSAGGLTAAERVDFNRDIRPILAEKCFQCHGPDEQRREANLRLDRAKGKEGLYRIHEGSQAVKPKDLKGSSLWSRLTTDNQDEKMPPQDAKKKPLTVEQLELIKRWILQGAEYKNFWAFEPPRAKAVPQVDDPAWSRQRIDRFVMARLQKEKLRPQPRAEKRTLIRRITLDLTGLPPTRSEIRNFLADTSDDAYQRLVDRLLATPRYGEHMAKYWLDLVRFADTNGIHHDHYREMTPYRDWVIRSFNQNLSFDNFITYQVAGDLYTKPSSDQQIASGFNRLHLIIDKGTALPEESFTRNVIDRVSTFGTAFLGLTLGCAVCHDHKYDPLTQRDFYKLYGFFNNIDATPETPGRNHHPPFIRVPTLEQKHRLSQIETILERRSARIAKLEKLVNNLKPGSDETSRSSTDKKRKSIHAEIQALRNGMKSLQAEKGAIEKASPVSLVMKERSEVRPTHILIRGAYDQPGKKVERDTPDFLPPITGAKALKTRMDLARWLIGRQNPLTARVAVNRFWQQFFGIGLVKTSEDFGTQGEWPSHIDLLDDLSVGFVDSGWNVKRLVRSMVLSQTYQQSSKAPAAAYRADPQNRLLARGSRFRLDSEMIRDQVLAASGLLNRSMYGKSVKPPQPPNLWKTVSMVSSSTYSFQADRGEKIFRRSVYSFWKRAMPPPQMTIFDAPTRESCIARRERTNTPVQALVLMNEKQYFNASRYLARQLLFAKKMKPDVRLAVAYETITAQLPDATELASLRQGLRALQANYRKEIGLAKAMTVDLKNLDDGQRVELAAHTMLMNALFNLDITKTRD